MAPRRVRSRSARQRLTRPRRRVAACAVAAGLLAAACGAGADPADPSPSSTTSGTTATTTAGTTVAERRPLRIMPLGDSLTEGDDPSKPTTSPQSYRGYLEAGLRAAGLEVDLVGSHRRPAIGGTDPDHEGHGGFTIGPDQSTLCAGCGPANLDAGLDGWLRQAQPDVVLLLAGVNDLLPQDGGSGGARRPTVPSEAAAKLRALVGRIRTLAPEASVLVASYPPISFMVDPALSNAPAFDALNAAARQLGDGRDPAVHYVPLAERFAGSWTASDVLSAVGDDLHPSATGAQRMAAVWLEVLRPIVVQRQAGR